MVKRAAPVAPHSKSWSVGIVFSVDVSLMYIFPAVFLQFNLKRGGQRVATMLMYLTDGVEGGETFFPWVKFYLFFAISGVVCVLIRGLW